MAGWKHFFDRLPFSLILPGGIALLALLGEYFDYITKYTPETAFWGLMYAIGWSAVIAAIILVIAVGAIGWFNSDIRADPVRLIIDSFKAQKKANRAKIEHREKYISSCRQSR